MIFCLAGFIFVKSSYAATFSFSPVSQSVALNEQFTLNILLDTANAETDGADAIITYDSLYLTPISASLGSLYDTVVTNSTSTSNKVILSAVASGNTNYSGSGTFATVTFKAIKAGSTDVSFNYISGATTDSNITSNQADVLSSVNSTTITISGDSTTTYTPPRSGTIEWSLLLLGLGGFGLLSGFYLKRQTT